MAPTALHVCDAYPSNGWCVSARHPDGSVERLGPAFPSTSEAFAYAGSVQAQVQRALATQAESQNNTKGAA